MNNHRLILLLILVSAHLHQGKQRMYRGIQRIMSNRSDVILPHVLFLLTSCRWSNITQLIDYSI